MSVFDTGQYPIAFQTYIEELFSLHLFVLHESNVQCSNEYPLDLYVNSY